MLTLLGAFYIIDGMNEHLETRECCLLRITDLEGKVYIGSTIQPIDEYLDGLIRGALSGNNSDKNAIGRAILDRGLDDFSIDIFLVASEPECRRLKPIFWAEEGTIHPGGNNICSFRQGSDRPHMWMMAHSNKSKSWRETLQFRDMVTASLRCGQETRSRRAGYPTRQVLGILKEHSNHHVTVAELRLLTGFSLDRVKGAINCLRQRGELLVNILPKGYRFCDSEEIFKAVEAKRVAGLDVKIRVVAALSNCPEGLTCGEIARIVGITKAQARNACYTSPKLEGVKEKQVYTGVSGISETRFHLRAKV